MSTATSALRSFDPAAATEPPLRRRGTARAPRRFALVRQQASHPVDTRTNSADTAPAAPTASTRPAAAAPVETTRSIVRSGVLSAPVHSPSADIVRAPRRIELTDAELDLAFATVPRSEPARRIAEVRRPTVDRGPQHRAPRSELSLYARGPVRAGGARGAHPLHRVEQAKAGFAALAVTALVTALIVVAFLGLAHMRAGGFADRVDSTVPGISEQAGNGSGGPFEPGR